MADPEDLEADGAPSYIDYETFLSPTFHAPTFANTLLLSTNNPSDTSLDLSTPLSRVLFDIQEIDSHIDRLTTRSAQPLLQYTQAQNAASRRIIEEVDPQIEGLNDSYKQLEKEVIQKHAEAEQVRLAAGRLWEALWLGRAVSRALVLGRQLEVQHAELTGAARPDGAAAGGTGEGAGGGSGASGAGITSIAPKKEDHRALVRCAHTILALRELLEPLIVTQPMSEGDTEDKAAETAHLSLAKINVITALRATTLNPITRTVRETSERFVREFALPSTLTFAQSEEVKSRTISALTTLWLLSPLPSPSSTTPDPAKALEKAMEKWTPELMLYALESYLRTALQSSLAALARSLAQLPTLERTLAEVAGRCGNVVALEGLLAGTKAPVHPLLTAITASQKSTGSGAATEVGKGKQATLLQPLLSHLETGSLASYFWRTMAGGLATRVQEIISRGGVAARTLRTNRQSVADAIRECVINGSAGSGSTGRDGKNRTMKSKDGSGEPQKDGAARWEREAAVMVGAVVGSLGR
jgi:hypothetical protein